MTYKIGDKVEYWSYLDGEINTGKIERFTENGIEIVAVITYNGKAEKYNGRIQKIALSNIKKPT